MVTSITSGSNAACSIRLVGQPRQRHHVQQLTWSYNGTPGSSATLMITGLEGDTITFDITAGGPGALPLPPSCYGKVATDVVLSLGAGGAGVVGKLNALSELE